MPWICYNDSFLPADQPIFTAANRGFKYGDGLFETATFRHNNLLLAAYHFERLFSGLKLLNIIPHFTQAQLIHLIMDLCEKNNCRPAARVRLAVYREENSDASFVIEATDLDENKMQWNETGWTLNLYPFARKSCDALANLKSANYLPYVLAAQHAKAQSVDECLVLNMQNRLCDGSKTNLFFLKEGEVFTPALSEGCVAGVMRRAVIEFLKKCGYAVHQKPITEEELLQADHVFLTNAIEGLRWVQQFKERKYEYGLLKKLHQDFLATLVACE